MTSLALFTNRNAHGDFVVNAIEALSEKPCNVYISVAFFTEQNIVERIVKNGCHVRLVVRLGFPTQPDALEQLMGNSEIEIRYFTDTAFHPKLFLFGNQAALVGSANLTRSAVTSNQEVVVLLGPEDERLNELASLFSEYWSQAKVLTQPILTNYRSICARYSQLRNEQYKLDQEIINKLGRVFAGDVIKDKSKQSKENIFLEEFRKKYQECITAFNVIRNVYENVGKRKVAPGVIPIRLEIDSFISFVREKHTSGESWRTTPILTMTEQWRLIEPLVREWLDTPWPHFDETIVNINFPRLQAVFSSPQTIQASSDDDLFEALCTAHSFYDRLRFFPGGLPTWRSVFLKANDPSKSRDSLSYLLHGAGDIEERMANVIYSPAYKLNEFGQANVQELIGWCNNEDLPVVNGRTTKVLRWFGFDVVQL